MTKAVYNHILRIKSELDRYVRGINPSLDMVNLISYIDWCIKYKKASRKVLDKLVEYILAIQDMNDEEISKYINMDFTFLMDSEKPKKKFQVFCRSSEPYSKWFSCSRKYDTQCEANNYILRAQKITDNSNILYKIKEC